MCLLAALAGCAGEFYGTIGDWEPDDLSRRPSLEQQRQRTLGPATAPPPESRPKAA